MKQTILVLALFSLAISSGFAQERKQKELLYSNRLSVLAGLLQPVVLSGGNIEFNYFTKRISFDYSHGFSLDVPPVGDFGNQNVVLHLPYSTGFGIGYRFTSFLDLRFEPKLHSWELYYDNESQEGSNKINSFKTFTLGMGIYYRYFPFRNNDSKFLQGITTSTSVRYWQNVNTTLENNEINYFNKTTQREEKLKAPNIGISNTPILFNISVGYTFGGK